MLHILVISIISTIIVYSIKLIIRDDKKTGIFYWIFFIRWTQP